MKTARSIAEKLLRKMLGEPDGFQDEVERTPVFIRLRERQTLILTEALESYGRECRNAALEDCAHMLEVYGNEYVNESNDLRHAGAVVAAFSVKFRALKDVKS